MGVTVQSPLPAHDRAAIEALLTEFYWRLDHPQSGTVADLFTQSGTLVTPRFELSGRQQIAQWFAGRARRTTRHSWSNLRLAGDLPTGVSAEAYLITAAAPPAADCDGAQIVIGDTKDLVVRDESNVWRFASRRLSIIFEGRLATKGTHSS